jgi:short-subunit dehydrogenase
MGQEIMSFFSDKLAYITGGSSGIGLETAVRLSLLGCRLVLLARGQAKLEEACRYIEEKAGQTGRQIHTVYTVSTNVANNDEVVEKIKAAVDHYGMPDILINSAGIGMADYFENISYESFDAVMKVNVYGTRNTVRAVLPYMKQKGCGHIVNLSSAAGLMGMFGYSLYSTSKYAVVGFSECLRSELKRYDIHVSVVCPPEVKTPFIEEEAKTLPPEARAVKSLAGLLEPSYVAKSIVKGIKKKRFLIVPGILTKWLYFNHRISNGHLTRITSDWIVRFVSGRLQKTPKPSQNQIR